MDTEISILYNFLVSQFSFFPRHLAGLYQTDRRLDSAHGP